MQFKIKKLKWRHLKYVILKLHLSHYSSHFTLYSYAIRECTYKEWMDIYCLSDNCVYEQIVRNN